MAATALIAGCGSTAAARAAPLHRPPAGAPFLATSLGTAAGTWAVAVMGGSAAAHNNFWQLFVRPAGRQRWKLATPPGTADNGGLVVADAGGRSLMTAFRPSQDLTYTPLAATRDGGQAWSSAGPLDAALADVPDALAAAPGSGSCSRCSPMAPPSWPAPATPGWNTAGHPADPRRHPGRPALRAAPSPPPHTPPPGCRCWPAMLPPRNRGHLRRQQRHLAGSRTR